MVLPIIRGLALVVFIRIYATTSIFKGRFMNDDEKAREGAEAMNAFLAQFGTRSPEKDCVLEVLFEVLNYKRTCLSLPRSKGQTGYPDSGRP